MFVISLFPKIPKICKNICVCYAIKILPTSPFLARLASHAK